MTQLHNINLKTEAIIPNRFAMTEEAEKDFIMGFLHDIPLSVLKRLTNFDKIPVSDTELKYTCSMWMHMTEEEELKEELKFNSNQ